MSTLTTPQYTVLAPGDGLRVASGPGRDLIHQGARHDPLAAPGEHHPVGSFLRARAPTWMVLIEDRGASTVWLSTWMAPPVASRVLPVSEICTYSTPLTLTSLSRAEEPRITCRWKKCSPPMPSGVRTSEQGRPLICGSIHSPAAS